MPAACLILFTGLGAYPVLHWISGHVRWGPMP
jgi:hypothetical protein